MSSTAFNLILSIGAVSGFPLEAPKKTKKQAGGQPPSREKGLGEGIPGLNGRRLPVVKVVVPKPALVRPKPRHHLEAHRILRADSEPRLTLLVERIPARGACHGLARADPLARACKRGNPGDDQRPNTMTGSVTIGDNSEVAVRAVCCHLTTAQWRMPTRARRC